MTLLVAVALTYPACAVVTAVMLWIASHRPLTDSDLYLAAVEDAIERHAAIERQVAADARALIAETEAFLAREARRVA